MLRAAYKLFCERRYAGTTMQAIAEAAGVAVQTLYFTFHTKAALLDEVVGFAVVGFDRWVPPAGHMTDLDLKSVTVLRRYHPWLEPMEAAGTAHEALSLFVAGGVEIMERAAPLTSVMREASSDPAARAVYLLGEERRADAYRVVIRILAKKPPGLRQRLTPRRATDLLLTVFSGDTYQQLRDRGWKRRAVQVWLLDVLGHQLLSA